MEITLPRLKMALMGQLSKNEIVANNLANMDTNGYKKDIIFFEHLKKNMDKTDSGAQQSVYFKQGPLKQTKNPFDFALSGRGFFTVETANGIAYTREGHFKVDEDGILRTVRNEPVMGASGWISVVLDDNITPEKITVTKDGEIFADGKYLDKLQITDFEDIGKLVKKGNNMFVVQGDAGAFDVEEPNVQQGFLEGSNVNPAEEMIQLIEVQRQFESAQKMVQSMDSIFRTAVNRIAEYK
ncbi:MAG TPA: flagellar basal-body rod protein FlgF [Caldithrix abyssi]|uniref:Flagellar basal-body rod protein FlgF n=1 Tax=Caldithrix abyssi TaxID=187145 RepID=A0A7V4TZM6_CALAY|nr:flagellar basal-body rod protein FlgF [Caldithrix abyssi]